MASGNFQFSTQNADVKGRITWSSTPNQTNNNSSVTATLQMYRSDSLTSYGTYSGTIKIDGSSKSVSKYAELTSSAGWITIGSYTKTVAHNSDGKKSITISVSGSANNSVGSYSGSKTVTLDEIERGSIPTASDTFFGQNLTVNTNRKSTAFTHKIDLLFGTKKASKTGVATSTTFEIPEDWAAEIPTATYGVLTITCTTYNGSTQVGVNSIRKSISVPSGWVPTLGGVEKTVNNAFGEYILKGMSSVTIKATGAVPTLGARIKSFTFSGADLSATVTTTSDNATATSKTLSASGEQTWKVTVTDTRGRTASLSVSDTITDYQKPSLTLDTSRCTQEGTSDDAGAYAISKIKCSVSNLTGLEYELSLYKQSDTDTTQTLVQKWDETTSKDVTSSVYACDDTKTYVITAVLTDNVGSTVSTEMRLSNGYVTIDFLDGGRGITFGGTATEEGVRVVNLPFMTEIMRHLDGTEWFDDVIVEATIPNVSTEWKTIKTEKGLAICWVKIVGTASITNTWGSIYTNATKPYATFPFSFIGEPTVIMSPSSVTGLNGDYWLGKVNMAQTATRSGDIGLWRATSGTGINYGIYVMAIGRYK